jgi:2-C-methyl-D-erythritol 4-phosphate cytidylyltransferase/2-C-methyl-D-erythritol 2,4-cyclodiphosphate synthase
MNIVLIVAAGESKRMGRKTSKVLLPIFGKPILYYTASAFYDHPKVDRIVIVVNKKISKHVEKIIRENFPGDAKKIRFVVGGGSRSESVLNGFSYIKRYLRPKKKDVILIHNGVNPLVTSEEIAKCISGAKTKGACVVAHPIKSTLKEVKRKRIVKTHNRDNFVKAQTPQGFQVGIFESALKKIGGDYVDMTDEANLVEKAGYKVVHIPASDQNIKITTKKDYSHARHMMGDLPDDFLVGLGQDSHAFSSEKGLYLGGLRFGNEYKLEANSDGDVLLHSLCNALLQAIGDRSLGAFADNLCLKKKIKDSRKYLEVVMRKVRKKGYKLNNVGLMVEGKRPNIDKISPRLKTNLEQLLDIPAMRIGITATSGEKLTSFGKGKGIQVFSIVSLKKL